MLQAANRASSTLNLNVKHLPYLITLTCLKNMASSLTAPEAFPTPNWPDVVMQDVSLIQDTYPHIGEKIKQSAWGSIELQEYLTSIIFDERGGRKGFPSKASSALFRIYDANRRLIPPTGDIWDHILKSIDQDL
ncbi:MAG: hypothetical protein ACLQHK_07570 [Gallionellaceae bacterium]